MLKRSHIGNCQKEGSRMSSTTTAPGYGPRAYRSCRHLNPKSSSSETSCPPSRRFSPISLSNPGWNHLIFSRRSYTDKVLLLLFLRFDNVCRLSHFRDHGRDHSRMSPLSLIHI